MCKPLYNIYTLDERLQEIRARSNDDSSDSLRRYSIEDFYDERERLLWKHQGLEGQIFYVLGWIKDRSGRVEVGMYLFAKDREEALAIYKRDTVHIFSSSLKARRLVKHYGLSDFHLFRQCATIA